MPCNTFSEIAVSHLIYAARLMLKWIMSCCGLKKAEANNITTKEPLIKVIRRWKWTYLPLPETSIGTTGWGGGEWRRGGAVKALKH